MKLLRARLERIAAWTFVAVLGIGSVQFVRADELADKGRDLLNKHQHAIMTVEVVMKMRFSLPGLASQANEYKQDLTGTVIDPSGLTVLALSTCEPSDLIQTMMSGMSESDDDAKSTVNTELSDIKLLREDGTEVPADIVLRDKDLDLAFIRPKTKPSTPMAALDLSQAGTAQILDQVISLNRLGEAAGRSYAASVERISSVARKPRLFYVPSGDSSSVTMGAPVFTADGKVLGIYVTRSINRKSNLMELMSSRSDALTPIILPGADVLKAAQQAPEAKPEASKSEPQSTNKPAAK